MKIGVRFYGVEPTSLAKTARRAEELGYESLWRGEHLILPSRLRSEYPYGAGQHTPFDPDAPLLDLFSVFSFAAAVTSRIRLATGVYLLPLRNPFVTARDVVTLDVLSGGRAIFGVGVGWLEDEFCLVGESFRDRGRRTDECIKALKALWTRDAPEFHGQFYSFAGVSFEPKPTQRPHPPIVVGGESHAAMVRAATLGDGWYVHRARPAEVRRQLRVIQSLRRDCGREADPFEVTVRVGPNTAVAEVQELADAGVSRVVLEVGDLALLRADEIIPAMEAFADTVLSKV